MASLGLSSSANSDGFISSFLYWMPFLSFSFLIAVARDNTMVNEHCASGHLCLGWKAFSFSQLNVLLAVVCYLWPLLCWGTFFVYSVESFYHKMGVEFCKCFFNTYWDYHMICILHFVNMVYHIDFGC